MNKATDAYTIRQVVDLTGLSEFTLRGWENRYEAFRPNRTATGRRMYSQADLQKAILLRELLLRDHRIGEIAELSLGALRGLLAEKPGDTPQAPGPYRPQREAILRHLSLQNWDALKEELRKTTRKDKPLAVLVDLIAPLVLELGQLVASGVVSISQEHIFSSLLKERLYVLSDEARKASREARFVVAAPEGDFHELGILIAHAMLAQSGVRSLYVGPNTPKNELCETIHRFGASHVLLGSTVSRKEGAKEDLYTYLHFLDKHLSRKTSIWLGGRNASSPLGELERGLVRFSSLLEFEKALRYLE
jgi:methanogenic corrinoid protein MtbC1